MPTKKRKPKVLYKSKEVTLTKRDVAKAIAQARERVGDEFACSQLAH